MKPKDLFFVKFSDNPIIGNCIGKKTSDVRRQLTELQYTECCLTVRVSVFQPFWFTAPYRTQKLVPAVTIDSLSTLWFKRLIKRA